MNSRDGSIPDTHAETVEVAPSPQGSLKAKALHGAWWTLGGFGFSRILRLLNHVVLAWLLTPQIFGLMTLVKVFKQGLEMFSDVGIRSSIIRSPRGNDPLFLNTAWTIQVVRGCLLWLASCLLAFPYAWAYSQNDAAAWQLVYFIPVAALAGLLGGFQSTAMATLNKEMRLGKLTMVEVKSQLLALAVMATWAYLDPSVWALIGGGLVGTTYRLVESYRVIPGHRNWFAWDRECASELFHFGKWIFLSTVLSFLALNMDRLSLAGVLTLSDLGVYGIAVVFSKVALDVSMRLGSTVMFPIYANLQGDPDRLMTIALKARRVVLWVGSATCICFAICAPLFFETLWDERYQSAGSTAQWLSVFVWARILLNSMDRIPVALGNSRALFNSNCIQFCGILPAAVGYWLGGLPLFILGLSLGPFVSHLVLIRSLPTRQAQMLSQTMKFTCVGLSVGVALVSLTVWLRGVTSPAVGYVSLLVCCLCVLAATAWGTWDLILEKRLRKGTKAIRSEGLQTP